MGRFHSLIGALEREEWDLLAQREAQSRLQTTRTLFILSAGTSSGLGLLLIVLFILNSEAVERRDAEAASHLAAEIWTSTGEAVITTTLAGIITSWNYGANRILGYTAQETIGSPLLNLIPPDCADDENKTLSAIGRGERAEHFEIWRLRKDGQRASVSVTISPLKDDARTIYGAVKILRDITERKQAEKALRASEERFRTMANSIPQLSWIAHGEGFIYWYNE